MPPKPQHLSGNTPDDPDSDSDDSFHSLHSTSDPTPPQPNPQPSHDPSEPLQPSTTTERFSPEEEATHLSSSHALKSDANSLFGKGSFSTAIQTYDQALASCPNYLDYELAVLRSNIAACHLKLAEWKEAIDSAEKGVECLERLEPLPPAGKGKDADEGVEEVDEELEGRIERLRESGKTLDQVRKLQVKLLMRRAKGKTEVGGWASLQGAEEDYKILLSPTMAPCLSPTDRKSVMDAARGLGPRLTEAKEREMAEMMGKLKGLGNSILKPFGLSTENFQFVKDENTGGYSMNFDQGGGKK